jgi:hypothetical protein
LVVKRLESWCSLVVTAALAVVLAGCGSSSDVNGVTPPDDTAPPDAPVAVQLGADANGRAALVWTASTSASVSGYEVYEYSPDPSRDNAYVLCSDSDPGDTSFSLPSMGEDTSAIFRVRAVTAGGTRSAFSPTVTVQSHQVSGDLGGGGAGGPGDRPGEEIVDPQ